MTTFTDDFVTISTGDSIVEAIDKHQSANYDRNTYIKSSQLNLIRLVKNRLN